MSQNMHPAQRAMLLVLPIAFIPFVLNFPSGLMLYWVTTNLWTTGQGLDHEAPDAEAAAAAEEEPRRTPPKGRNRARRRRRQADSGEEAADLLAPARPQGEAEEGRLAAVTEIASR